MTTKAQGVQAIQTAIEHLERGEEHTARQVLTAHIDATLLDEVASGSVVLFRPAAPAGAVPDELRAIRCGRFCAHRAVAGGGWCVSHIESGLGMGCHPKTRALAVRAAKDLDTHMPAAFAGATMEQVRNSVTAEEYADIGGILAYMGPSLASKAPMTWTEAEACRAARMAEC